MIHPPEARKVLASSVNLTIYHLKSLSQSDLREYLIAGLAGYAVRDPAAYLRLLRADAVQIPWEHGPASLGSPRQLPEDLEDLILLIAYDSGLIHQPRTIAALAIKALILAHATTLLNARGRFS